MPDIIEQAYYASKARNWDDLCAWLKTHARQVNNLKTILYAGQRALEDGHTYPDSPEEARWILKKYEREVDPTLH